MLGLQEETRAKIVAALWQYIKSNRLQDPEERRFINLNAELQAIIGVDEKVEFHRLMQLVKPHLMDLKPATIQVPVKNGDSPTTMQYSMPVSVPSQTQQSLLRFLADHHMDFEFPTDD